MRTAALAALVVINWLINGLACWGGQREGEISNGSSEAQAASYRLGIIRKWRCVCHFAQAILLRLPDCRPL